MTQSETLLRLKWTLHWCPACLALFPFRTEALMEWQNTFFYHYPTLWVLKIKTTRLFLRVLLWQICHAFLSSWHIPQRRNPKASMCLRPHTDTGQSHQEQICLLHGSGTKALYLLRWWQGRIS